MAQFEEPEVLATFDRTWKDKKERLQLERGEYQGRSTFTLRQVWQPPGEDGWRWSKAREDSKGRCWASMSIKARELREFGEALIAAATDAGEQRMDPPRQQRSVRDTPQRQAQRDRFDRQGTIPVSKDSGLPF